MSESPYRFSIRLWEEHDATEQPTGYYRFIPRWVDPRSDCRPEFSEPSPVIRLKPPESPSNGPDPISGPSSHPTGDNAPESK